MRPPAQKAARVELICVGSELLDGQVNTHQSWLSVRMREAGLSLARASSVPDVVADIRDEIRAALTRCDALLLCGGLGPTFDDITREAVASALGRELIYRPDLYAAIEAKFARYRLPVPEENKRQAMQVAGADILENRFGSAPGQLVALPRRGKAAQIIALMPGPFSELAPIFDGAILPRLQETYARGVHHAGLVLRLSGIPESVADERLSPVIKQAGPELSFTILSPAGQVDFHAHALARTSARAKALIARVRRQAQGLVGEFVFGEGPETLESALGKLLRAKKLTLAVAESCTGGLIGARLTSVPGSSDYFMGGVLSYADSVKSGMLGVSPRTLKKEGAVSAPCAREMAAGVRKTAGSSIGLSVTGIAGPGGGSAKKPVGLVFIAICGPGQKGGQWRLKLSGDRETIRKRAGASALHLLLRHLRRL